MQKHLIRRTYRSVGALLLAIGALEARAQTPVRVTVDAGAAGVPVSPLMYGVFFEDINFGGDGGLSAELVKNGSFEFDDAIMGWRKVENRGAVGGIGFADVGPALVNNPRYARVTVQEAGEGFGLRNDGYRGMGFRQGAKYRFSALARLEAGEAQALRVELMGQRNAVLGSCDVQVAGNSWTRMEGEMTCSATEARGGLRLMLNKAGVIDLESVSLMPVDTWKGRKNGLRADIVQALADLKPAFVRFPGGCIVEGRTLANRYRWKATVGPVDDRKVIYNRWQVEFADRGKGAADYYQSFRVGFFEYFQLCEDIGAAPVPILNCGMACQFNSGELAPVAGAGMDEYVQDALDLIEFANGDASTAWGKIRAEMGHPEPFGLKAIGVGNEQWGAQYFERYEVMARAIREKHPEIQLIISAGPSPEDGHFRQAWEAIPRLQAGIVDEHSYRPPEWFLDNAGRYDARDRTGPKIFMGEYAAHVQSMRNTWRAAVAEAAFLTGLERNADLVVMTSYAPLLAHVDAWQWTPNLIWFDNLRVAGSANYQVQKLFGHNRPDEVVPVKVEGAAEAGGKARVFATAGRDVAKGELVIKVVNATEKERVVSLRVEGGKGIAGAGRAIVLAGGLDDENTLDVPEKVTPREEALKDVKAEIERSVPGHSVTVIRLPESR